MWIIVWMLGVSVAGEVLLFKEKNLTGTCGNRQTGRLAGWQAGRLVGWWGGRREMIGRLEAGS